MLDVVFDEPVNRLIRIGEERGGKARKDLLECL